MRCEGGSNAALRISTYGHNRTQPDTTGTVSDFAGARKEKGIGPFLALWAGGGGYLPRLHRSMLIRLRAGGQKGRRLLPPGQIGRDVAARGRARKVPDQFIASCPGGSREVGLRSAASHPTGYPLSRARGLGALPGYRGGEGWAWIHSAMSAMTSSATCPGLAYSAGVHLPSPGMKRWLRSG